MKTYLIYKILYITFFITSISLAQNKQVDSLKIAKLIQSAKQTKTSDKIDDKIKTIDSAIALSTKNPKLLIKSFLTKSRLLLKAARLDSAMLYCNKAQEIIKKENLEKYKGELFKNYAYVYSYKGEQNNALNFGLKALLLFEKQNNPEKLAQTYELLGVLNAQLGETAKGIDFFNKALQVYQKLGNQNKVAADYLNIGTAYFFSKKYPKAKHFFLKSLKANNNQDVENNQLLFLNLATIYQHLKKLDSAYYFQVKAIKLAESLQNKRLLPTLYYNAATVKFQQNEIDSTLYYASKGFQLAQKQKTINDK